MDLSMNYRGLTLVLASFFALLGTVACKDEKPVASASVGAGEASAKSGKPAAEEKKPIEVFAESVVQTEIFEPIVFAGYIESEHRYAVTAETAGVLESVKVRAGDKVTKGQALVVVKPVSQGLTYKSLVIVSPLSGTVTEISATAGYPIGQGESILMVEQDDKLILQVSIPAQDLPYAKWGSQVDLVAGDKLSKGKIVSVNSRADKVTGTFPARIHIDCAKVCADFPLGSLARATIRSNERRGFKIPLAWLQQQRKKVIVIDAENKAHWVPVSLGSYLGESVEITDGLKDGMRIVYGYAERPEEGDLLSLKIRDDKAISGTPADKPKG